MGPHQIKHVLLALWERGRRLLGRLQTVNVQHVLLARGHRKRARHRCRFAWTAMLAHGHQFTAATQMRYANAATLARLARALVAVHPPYACNALLARIPRFLGQRCAMVLVRLERGLRSLDQAAMLHVNLVLLGITQHCLPQHHLPRVLGVPRAHGRR